MNFMGEARMNTEASVPRFLPIGRDEAININSIVSWELFSESVAYKFDGKILTYHPESYDIAMVRDSGRDPTVTRGTLPCLYIKYSLGSADGFEQARIFGQNALELTKVLRELSVAVTRYTKEKSFEIFTPSPVD